MEDGVRWVEVRTVFITPFLLEGQESPATSRSMNFRIWLKCLTKRLKAARRASKGDSGEQVHLDLNERRRYHPDSRWYVTIPFVFTQ